MDARSRLRGQKGAYSGDVIVPSEPVIAEEHNVEEPTPRPYSRPVRCERGDWRIFDPCCHLCRRSLFISKVDGVENMSESFACRLHCMQLGLVPSLHTAARVARNSSKTGATVRFYRAGALIRAFTHESIKNADGILARQRLAPRNDE